MTLMTPSEVSRMKHTALMLVLASCTALAPERLRAAKCDIKDGAADWTDGRNYDNGIAPQLGDEVRVLEGRTVSLDASLDSGSMATVAALKQITLFGPDFSKCGKVVITVAENDTKELTAPFYGIIDNEPTGVVEKRGGGTLQLMNPRFVSTEDHGNNIGRLTVSAGTVCMPTNTPQCTFVCGIVEVAEGATFRLPWRREGESGAYYAQFRGLSGAGAVLTGSDKAMTIRVNGSYDLDFSGTIGEKVSLQCKGLQRLSGTGNRSPFVEVFGGNGDLSGKAVLSVAKIGMKNQSSSIGSSPLMANVGQGTFRYTGTGEVTDKEVLLYSPSGTGDAYPLQLDGGANGALVFTGDWKYSTADPPRMGHIVLSGENSSPCILSNNVAGWTSGERGYSFYLTKRGSGRWRFSDALTGWRRPCGGGRDG